MSLVFNVFLLRDHIKSYLNGMPPLMQGNLSSSVPLFFVSGMCALYFVCCDCPDHQSKFGYD